MAYQRIECYPIGTNCAIGTNINGQIECTPTQPEAIVNISSPQLNEMHLTNGIPTARVPFYWTCFVCIGQPSTFYLQTVLKLQDYNSWMDWCKTDLCDFFG